MTDYTVSIWRCQTVPWTQQCITTDEHYPLISAICAVLLYSKWGFTRFHHFILCVFPLPNFRCNVTQCMLIGWFIDLHHSSCHTVWVCPYISDSLNFAAGLFGPPEAPYHSLLDVHDLMSSLFGNTVQKIAPWFSYDQVWQSVLTFPATQMVNLGWFTSSNHLPANLSQMLEDTCTEIDRTADRNTQMLGHRC